MSGPSGLTPQLARGQAECSPTALGLGAGTRLWRTPGGGRFKALPPHRHPEPCWCHPPPTTTTPEGPVSGRARIGAVGGDWGQALLLKPCITRAEQLHPGDRASKALQPMSTAHPPRSWSCPSVAHPDGLLSALSCPALLPAASSHPSGSPRSCPLLPVRSRLGADTEGPSEPAPGQCLPTPLWEALRQSPAQPPSAPAPAGAPRD